MLTPVTPTGLLDEALFSEHAAMLLRRGVDGLAPFGTTGEGQSFSVAQRRAGLEALLAAGIPPSKIVPATGCAALRTRRPREIVGAIEKHLTSARDRAIGLEH